MYLKCESKSNYCLTVATIAIMKWCEIMNNERVTYPLSKKKICNGKLGINFH